MINGHFWIKISDYANNYVKQNIDVSYVKRNIVSIMFQLWFSPMLLMSLIQGTYYENNNEFTFIEYIRNYEIINLFLEYFYLNPYVFRSSNMIHHVISVIYPQTYLIFQNVNVPIVKPFLFLCNISITTNFLLDAVKIFHKNNVLKAVFFIYFTIIRIIIPFPFICNLTTGHYLYITPSEHIPITLFFSVGAYIGYGLHLFWFYKICRVVKKLIKPSSSSSTVERSQPCQPPDTPNLNPNANAKFVHVPCGH